jgi:hypothetical protein
VLDLFVVYVKQVVLVCLNEVLEDSSPHILFSLLFDSLHDIVEGINFLLASKDSEKQLSTLTFGC